MPFLAAKDRMSHAWGKQVRWPDVDSCMGWVGRWCDGDSCMVWVGRWHDDDSCMGCGPMMTDAWGGWAGGGLICTGSNNYSDRYWGFSGVSGVHYAMEHAPIIPPPAA